MIAGIDFDTIYLMDSLHHYPYVAEFPELRKKHPTLSESNICFYLGRNATDTKNVALLFDFDLQKESDLDKAYKVISYESNNTILLMLTPKPSKAGETKHQLLYGLPITGFWSKSSAYSYAYKIKDFSEGSVKCYPAVKGYFYEGEVSRTPKCVCALIETIGRKPYSISYGIPMLLKEVDKRRTSLVFIEKHKYTGPTVDAYGYLYKALKPTNKGTSSKNTKPKTIMHKPTVKTKSSQDAKSSLKKAKEGIADKPKPHKKNNK